MKPYYADEWVTIYHGDCREVLPGIDPVETCISDPPYGLEFMGKGWDKGVPGEEFWRIILGALLPGAPCLAFGGTRTHHRLMCAIEDAGFELRDCLMWLYGSGFPKSHDLSKGIDSAAGAEREVVGEQTKARSEAAKSALPTMGSPVKYETWDLTAPATEAAKLWNGWGTALKPAWEPIVLAMKPLVGTFARNGLRYGVAGLNIDGARIGTEDSYNVPQADFSASSDRGSMMQGAAQESYRLDQRAESHPSGRWPANVVLDEEAARQLDEQSGERVSGSRRPAEYGMMGFHGNGIKPMPSINGSIGGASRFFYTAKASASDRGENNNHPTVKPSDLMKWLSVLTKTPTAGTVLDPFMGSGTTIFAAKETGRRAIGIELDERYCEVAASRCAQGVLELVGA